MTDHCIKPEFIAHEPKATCRVIHGFEVSNAFFETGLDPLLLFDGDEGLVLPCNGFVKVVSIDFGCDFTIEFEGVPTLEQSKEAHAKVIALVLTNGERLIKDKSKHGMCTAQITQLF